MPWGRTFLLGFGFFGISLLWPLYDSFVPLFLRNFGLSNRVVGLGMTIDNYVNMFIQPWAGTRSDRTWNRFGRRFPFIIAAAPLAALGMFAMPFAADRSLMLLFAAMFLFTLSMAFFRTPTVALLGDMFPDTLRSKANGIINFMGVFAGVLAFVLGGILFDMASWYPFVAFPIAMLLILAILVTRIREPEVPYGGNEPSPGLRETFRSLWNDSDRNALIILLALLLWSVGITAVQAFWTLFGVNELGLAEGAASQLLSFYPLAGLLSAIPGGYLGAAIGRRNTIIIMLAIVAALLGVIFWIPAEMLSGAGAFTLMAPNTWFATRGIQLIILLLLGVGGAMTIVTVNILPLLFHNAPDGQIGGFTGLYYVAGSIASILGPPLGGTLADLTGSYRSILLFAPFWVILGLIVMLFVREQRPPVAA
ncbi:MAG: MFS transporter [Ardenticatenales bacterium]|nr:MFS transporter [Ardenticatenales bacterium]